MMLLLNGAVPVAPSDVSVNGVVKLGVYVVNGVGGNVLGVYEVIGSIFGAAVGAIGPCAMISRSNLSKSWGEASVLVCSPMRPVESIPTTEKLTGFAVSMSVKTIEFLELSTNPSAIPLTRMTKRSVPCAVLSQVSLTVLELIASVLTQIGGVAADGRQLSPRLDELSFPWSIVCAVDGATNEFIELLRVCTDGSLSFWLYGGIVVSISYMEPPRSPMTV